MGISAPEAKTPATATAKRRWVLRNRHPPFNCDWCGQVVEAKPADQQDGIQVLVLFGHYPDGKADVVEPGMGTTYRCALEFEQADEICPSCRQAFELLCVHLSRGRPSRAGTVGPLITVRFDQPGMSPAPKQSNQAHYTPPRYDEVFAAGTNWLDALASHQHGSHTPDCPVSANPHTFCACGADYENLTADRVETASPGAVSQ